MDKALFDRWGSPVHGVGADHEEIRPRLFHADRSLDHEFGQPVPVAGFLQSLELGEVHRMEDALGGMAAAQTRLNAGVDQTVVFDRRMPRHAA